MRFGKWCFEWLTMHYKFAVRLGVDVLLLVYFWKVVCIRSMNDDNIISAPTDVA